MIISLEHHSRCRSISLIHFQSSDSKIKEESKLDKIKDKSKTILKMVEELLKIEFTNSWRTRKKTTMVLHNIRIKINTQLRK